MAKKFQLRERGTNEKIYPITVKEAVGLSNVDNTSDADKPISTAQATKFTEIDNKLNRIDQEMSNIENLVNITYSELKSLRD